MKTFLDNDGRTWALKVNVASLDRVSEKCKVDLLDVAAEDPAVLQSLYLKPSLLCSIVHCLCETEMEARGVSWQSFAEAMGGDSIESARAALLEEIIDFFPSRQRPVLTLAIAKMEEMRQAMVDLGTARLNSPELAQVMDELLAGLGRKSTPTQESPESTPDPSPGES